MVKMSLQHIQKNFPGLLHTPANMKIINSQIMGAKLLRTENAEPANPGMSLLPYTNNMSIVIVFPELYHTNLLFKTSLFNVRSLHACTMKH